MENLRDTSYISLKIEIRLLRARLSELHTPGPDGEKAAERDYAAAFEAAELEGFTAVFAELDRQVLRGLQERNWYAKPPRHYPGMRESLNRILSCIDVGRTLTMPFTTGDTGKDLSFEPLTARERDVLKLLSDGLSYKEIAPALFISINTVRFHIKSIYAKLGVNSRTQAVNRARAFKML